MKAWFIALITAALALTACQGSRTGKPGLFPAPVSHYTCQSGEHLAVRLRGNRASVSVNGDRAVDLPAMGSEGTTYSNGRQTLVIEQGRVSWARGRAQLLPCANG